MIRNPRLALSVGFLAAATLACSAHRTVTVRVPPRIDLTQHEVIGVVDFESSAEGQLASLATRRFMESARRDQGLVRMVTLGSKDEALRSVGRDRWDPETYRALGRKHGVQTILTGELAVSDVKPDLRIAAGLRSGSLSAEVSATLAVQMVEASSGASIWSASSAATRTVGHLDVFRGKEFVFDADDPEEAYGALVDGLVEHATPDFHAHWERRWAPSPSSPGSR